jgi:hypothetical protein
VKERKMRLVDFRLSEKKIPQEKKLPCTYKMQLTVNSEKEE